MTRHRMEEIVKEQMKILGMGPPEFGLFSVWPARVGPWRIELTDLRRPAGAQDRRIEVPAGPNTEENVAAYLARELAVRKAT